MAASKTNLVNITLSSLSSGVTQQYQEGRFDSQVSEMTNCIPSITRGVLRRNPLEAIKTLTGVSASKLADSFVYTYDRGTSDEQYMVIIPGDGDTWVYNTNTGELIDNASVSSGVASRAYMTTPTGVRAKTAFKALTIGDQTFIVNTTVTPSMDSSTTTTSGYADKAFYWVKKTVSVVTQQYQSETDVGSLLKGYTYTLNNTTIEGEEDTRPSGSGLPGTGVDLNTSYKIAAAIAADSANSYASTADGAVAYRTSTPAEWEWSDSFGDEASIGVWKDITQSDKLPVNLPSALDGFIVKVSGGTSAEFDDYYLKYTFDNRTWKEVAAPGIEYKVDADTMPHVLYRQADSSFKLDTYNEVVGGMVGTASNWGELESGGQDGLDFPSFIGQPINNIFFHKNRLGFMTSDNIILSRTGSYGNFFIQTKQEVLDDDPIDLAVASTDVTTLRHAVPTAGQLIIFSDDTQFSLQSVEGPLTPNTADIIDISNYTYGNRAPAKAIGNKVFFTNQSGKSSQLYSYKVTDNGAQITEAVPMSIHLPTYIDESASNIIGHDVLGYTFIETEDKPTELIVLSSVVRGSEELQNAFHKWVFAKDLVATRIINNTLHILFSDGDFCKMSLEIPPTIGEVTYADTYNSIEGPTNFSSALDFSEFFVRDAKGKGTVRGRYQLRTMKYTVSDESKYKTVIASINNILFDSTTMMGTTWVDTNTWDDSKLWVEVDPFYTRAYKNDDLVTIMANSKKVNISFKENEDTPTVGFELATVNVEGFMHQRSMRR